MKICLKANGMEWEGARAKNNPYLYLPFKTGLPSTGLHSAPAPRTKAARRRNKTSRESAHQFFCLWFWQSKHNSPSAKYAQDPPWAGHYEFGGEHLYTSKIVLRRAVNAFDHTANANSALVYEFWLAIERIAENTTCKTKNASNVETATDEGSN